MKTLFSLRTFAITAMFFFCAAALHVSAQCKIMDAAVQWNSGDGTLKVFLTDTDGLAGLQVDVGNNSPDTLTTYNTQYSITGNSFGAGGSVLDNVLTVPIGSYAAGDYFVRVRVLLSNSSYNEIEIRTNN